MSSKINQAIQYIQLTPMWMFSFQKRKQPVPRKVMQGLPLIKEIEMLKETVQRKIDSNKNI